MLDSPRTIRPLFPLGRVVATPGALDALEPHAGFLDKIIAWHAHGEWGQVDAEDARTNVRSIRDGNRILSAYDTPDGVRVWLITEADRESTCALLPEEY